MKRHKFSNKRCFRKNHQYRELKRSIQILHHRISVCTIMVDKIRNSIDYFNLRFNEIDHTIDKLKKTIYNRFSPTIFVTGFIIGWLIIEVISHVL